MRYVNGKKKKKKKNSSLSETLQTYPLQTKHCLICTGQSVSIWRVSLKTNKTEQIMHRSSYTETYTIAECSMF